MALSYSSLLALGVALLSLTIAALFTTDLGSFIKSGCFSSTWPLPDPLPHLKLTYFDSPGRAELSRLVFSYGGISFEDDRINRPDWAALKPTMPLGQVPVLQVDGVMYPQSMAIAKYGAKLSGLYPHDPLEALMVDMIAGTFGDLEQPLSDIRYREKDEAVKAQKTKVFLEETIPRIFIFLEKSVRGKFFLGSIMTLADLQLFDVVANKLEPIFAEFQIATFPKLAKIIENVKADPKVAAYLAK